MASPVTTSQSILIIFSPNIIILDGSYSPYSVVDGRLKKSNGLERWWGGRKILLLPGIFHATHDLYGSMADMRSFYCIGMCVRSFQLGSGLVWSSQVSVIPVVAHVVGGLRSWNEKTTTELQRNQRIQPQRRQELKSGLSFYLLFVRDGAA